MQLVTPPGRKLRKPIDLSLRISVLAPRSSFLKRAKPAGVSKRENIFLTRNFPSWTVAGSILVARSKILAENPFTCDSQISPILAENEKSLLMLVLVGE